MRAKRFTFKKTVTKKFPALELNLTVREAEALLVIIAAGSVDIEPDHADYDDPADPLNHTWEAMYDMTKALESFVVDNGGTLP